MSNIPLPGGGFTTSNATFDGELTTPQRNGPIMRWQDPETRGIMYMEKLQVRLSRWTPTERGTRGPNGSFLVAESQPRHIGGPVAEWDRTFAEVPASRTEPYETVFTYQKVLGGTVDAGFSLAEIPMPTTGIALYEYFQTDDPSEIPVIEAYRARVRNGYLYYVGEIPAANADYFVAENSSLRRVWPGGDIFERKTIKVRKLTITELQNG